MNLKGRPSVFNGKIGSSSSDIPISINLSLGCLAGFCPSSFLCLSSTELGRVLGFAIVKCHHAITGQTQIKIAEKMCMSPQTKAFGRGSAIQVIPEAKHNQMGIPKFFRWLRYKVVQSLLQLAMIFSERYPLCSQLVTRNMVPEFGIKA